MLMDAGEPLTVAFGRMFLIVFQRIFNMILAIYYVFKKNKKAAKWNLLASNLVLIIGIGTCFGNIFMLEEVFDKKASL
ncbi:MAG: hypothetical protein ACI9DJ_001614 [Algoriphagus sp.]|jgi:hypothetical protein